MRLKVNILACTGNYSILGKDTLSGSGTSWDRTSDARIFSPSLYQLSYGTSKNQERKSKK
jgi:hypothetical protein